MKEKHAVNTEVLNEKCETRARFCDRMRGTCRINLENLLMGEN